MINELAGYSTRSENIYFANNEETSIAVFTAVFYFTHAEHHLIKLKLCNIDKCKLQTVCYVKFKEIIKFAHF